MSEKQEYHLYDDGGKNLPICKVCFHSKKYKLHISEETALVDVQAEMQYKEISLTPRSVELAHSHLCSLCFKPEVHLSRESCNWTTNDVCPECIEKNNPTEVLCKGHTCEGCGKTWTHNYKCNKDYQSALCRQCASQAGADSYRHTAIEQIAKIANGLLIDKDNKDSDTKQVNSKYVDAINYYDEFIVLNLLKDENGKDRPDWQEKMSEHILKFEEEIQRLRVGISRVHIAGAKKRSEDFERQKLTPEELSEYRKQASRPPYKDAKKVQAKIDSDREKEKMKKKKAWNALKVKTMSDIMSVNKKLTVEQAEKRALSFMESEDDFINREEN